MLYMHAHAILVGHASLVSDEPTLRHDIFCVSRLCEIDSCLVTAHTHDAQ